MSQGVYGTRVASKVTANDVEIFYTYRETRNSDNNGSIIFQKLPSTILTQALVEKDSESIDDILEGMYNLKLPLSYFNKKGFYTVYIRPREIHATIEDVSSLNTFPDVKGIIINTESFNDEYIRSKFSENNSLVGYRVEYFSKDGVRQDYYRLVTSNNKCEPVTQNVTNSQSVNTVYAYNGSSSLTFITLTPSTAASFKTDSAPYIGTSGTKVVFINTMFEPIMLDIEMVDHDIDTVSTMLEGSQLRDLENGLITTFNDNGEIYNQQELYSLKDEYTKNPIYEVKKNKVGSVDFSQALTDK